MKYGWPILREIKEELNNHTYGVLGIGPLNIELEAVPNVWGNVFYKY